MEFVAFERLTLGDFKAMKEELEMLRAFKFEVEKSQSVLLVHVKRKMQQQILQKKRKKCQQNKEVNCMSSFRWYEENEVIGKTIIEEDDLTLLEAGKIYIDAIFCERIRFPVQKRTANWI